MQRLSGAAAGSERALRLEPCTPAAWPFGGREAPPERRANRLTKAQLWQVQRPKEARLTAMLGFSQEDVSAKQTIELSFNGLQLGRNFYK